MLRFIGVIGLTWALGGIAYPAQLLINEFVIGTPDDWVELFLSSNQQEQRDISSLYVTSYYGKNEPLATEPVTIYSYDRPETPWDDRFVIVHLTKPGIADETDLTGDANHNGAIDLYCNNYSGGLWNTDGVVAIDRDDDAINGGIIDLVFYSNRDGRLHPSTQSTLDAAVGIGQWLKSESTDREQWGVPIGADGLPASLSICRSSVPDSNGPADFVISPLPTPGRPNITMIPFMGRRLFKALRHDIPVIPRSQGLARGEIPLFVFFPCSIRFRIFSPTGMLIYESLEQSLGAGFTAIPWNPAFRRGYTPTGLYLCKLEAWNRTLRLRQEQVLSIIVSRYR